MLTTRIVLIEVYVHFSVVQHTVYKIFPPDNDIFNINNTFPFKTKYKNTEIPCFSPYQGESLITFIILSASYIAQQSVTSSSTCPSTDQTHSSNRSHIAQPILDI